jgi:hypothetical protein
MLLFLMSVFFLPTAIALAGRHTSLAKIALLNLLLAPSVIGWLFVLYLALSAPRVDTPTTAPTHRPKAGAPNSLDAIALSKATGVPFGVAYWMK